MTLEILSQLKFSGMNEKLEAVAQPLTKTFNWLYDSAQLDFVNWLEQGHGIYWISGNAGSGKSTLMKFLLEDQRTNAQLKVSSSTVVEAHFFFHDRSTNDLAKSQEGLLRALLWQILHTEKTLIKTVLPRRWLQASNASLKSPLKLQEPSWTIRELNEAFGLLLSQNTVDIHVFMIIDGLDEFNGNYSDVLGTIENFEAGKRQLGRTRMQVCISSRPEASFEYAFRNSRRLHIQSFTHNDIKVYVEEKFKKNAILTGLMKYNSSQTLALANEIARRASGIFLWVVLVVKLLIQELQNSDTIEDVKQRFEYFPPGLEALYRNIVEGIHADHQAEAAKFFSIVYEMRGPLTAVGLSFAMEDSRFALADVASPLSFMERNRRVKQLIGRVKSRCRGLVEVVMMSTDDADVHSIPRVYFMHATVTEFFRSSSMRTWIKRAAADGPFDPHMLILDSCLRQLIRDCCYDHATSLGVEAQFLASARHSEAATHFSPYRYLDAFDRLKSTQHQAQAAISMRKEHWTAIRAFVTYAHHWKTDFMSYMVTLGMTQYVLKKFESGYNVKSKRGRPLLFYAISFTPERFPWVGLDGPDPELVKALIVNGCNPKEEFDNREPLKDAFLYLIKRFPIDDNLDDSHTLADDQVIKLKWLQVISIFLDHETDLTFTITSTSMLGMGLVKRTATVHRSARCIFEHIFCQDESELLISIRQRMISKGALFIEVITLEYGNDNRVTKVSEDLQSTRHIMSELAGRPVTH